MDAKPSPSPRTTEFPRGRSGRTGAFPCGSGNFPSRDCLSADSTARTVGLRCASSRALMMTCRLQRLGPVGALLAGLGSPLVAHAQPASPPPTSAESPERASRTMSLDEAIAFARSHHLRITAARQRVVAAEREAEVASAQWFPRVGAMAQVVGTTTNNSTATLLATATVDLPRIGATPVVGNYNLEPYPSTAAALGIRQQLYDFGRVQARAAADLATVVERYRASGNALDVDFAVRQAYYSVLAADAIADASRAAFLRASSHRNLARANVRSGLRPPIEQTRAEADVARYEAATVRARASVRVARIAFAVTVGVDDEELGATGGTPKTPPFQRIMACSVTPSELRRCSKDGLEVREAQRGETRRLEAQTRPTLWATASASGRAGGATPSNGPTPYGEGWLPTVPNYSAADVLTWPVFEPTWDRRAESSRARELAIASEAQFALRSQRALIRTAYQEAKSLGKRLVPPNEEPTRLEQLGPGGASLRRRSRHEHRAGGCTSTPHGGGNPTRDREVPNGRGQGDPRACSRRDIRSERGPMRSTEHSAVTSRLIDQGTEPAVDGACRDLGSRSDCTSCRDILTPPRRSERQQGRPERQPKGRRRRGTARRDVPSDPPLRRDAGAVAPRSRRAPARVGLRRYSARSSGRQS